MSDKKISELTDGGALQDTDLVPVARSGVTYSVAGSEFGGQAPITREVVRGDSPDGLVVIANFDTSPLLWNQKLQGDDLLDISTPSAPTVVTAGVYAFSCQVRVQEAMTDGGYYYVSFDADVFGDDAAVTNISTAADAALSQPLVNIDLTWYCPAAAQLSLTVENDDGAAARAFRLVYANVQRIS